MQQILGSKSYRHTVAMVCTSTESAGGMRAEADNIVSSGVKQAGHVSSVYMPAYCMHFV